MKNIMSSLNMGTCILFTTLVCCSTLLFPLLVGAASWLPEKVLKDYILENYPWEEIEVKYTRVIGEMPDEKPSRITVEKGPIGNSLFYLWFGDKKKIAVQASVDAYEMVMKSKRPFRKGYVIKSDDIYAAKMSIKKIPQGAVSDSQGITGKALKRSIAANMPVVQKMMEISKVVKRGQHVVLLVEQNGLNITAAGKTKEKGYVGMPVKAINIDSNKEVVGILIDENTIRVRI
ncbi:MAG: flagellar basal body P-ring formation protein FlgA [Nitrospiraceae bacterium]|nr:MAG: flagellar basal body P-ring formation protein FlgA [Nitrospiraceae bacterium]